MAWHGLERCSRSDGGGSDGGISQPGGGVPDSLPVRNPWPPICSLLVALRLFCGSTARAHRGPSSSAPQPLSLSLSKSLLHPPGLMSWPWLSPPSHRAHRLSSAGRSIISSTSNGHPAPVSTSLCPRYSRCNQWLLQRKSTYR
ncbi:hypothetical protein V8C26DRAFT_327711 [Trichoderma gracile]